MKKLSQEQLAEKVGVSRQSVSKWECGESYPEMCHILSICTIFHCQINDLVHEDFVDIDLLDKDIKMKVVKFKQGQQQKMKVLSKTIALIAHFANIIMLIGLVLAIAIFIMVPIISHKVTLGKKTIALADHNYNYQLEDNHLIITDQKDKVIFNVFIKSSTNLDDYLTTHSLNFLAISSEYILICLIGTMMFISLLLRSLEKLFKNIHHENSPFTLQNIQLIKNIAFYLIIIIVLPFITGLLFEFVTKIDMNIELEIINLVVILVMISFSYIFEYGYQIQLDSNGKMYGGENE